MAERIKDTTEVKLEDTCKRSGIKDERLKLEITHQSCDLCRDDGNKATAASFSCMDCNAFMCIACYKAHTRAKHLGRHVLKDIESLPLSSDETWEEHQEESITIDTCIKKSQSEQQKNNRQLEVTSQVLSQLRKVKPHRPEPTLWEMLRTALSQNILLGCFISLPVDRLKVRMSKDEGNCYITGIEKLSDNRLIIADRVNQKLKLLDITSNTVISEIKDMWLWDLTKIDDKTIAVAVNSSEEIRIVSVSDELTVKQTIDKTELGYIMSIVYWNDTLIVSYHFPDHIQIQNVNGGVIRNFEGKGDDGTVKFGEIGYIALSLDKNTLYLSDYTYHKIHRMTHDGEIISSFTHSDLNGPYGIAVSGDGRIFVCSYHVHKILEVSADLSKGKVLLRKWDGIRFPVSIVYDEEERKLYVGSLGSKEIKIFLV